MILHVTYEEMSALSRGADAVLHGGPEEEGGVLAPPAARSAVEALLPHLTGDMSLETLEEQRWMELATEAIVSALRNEMEENVVSTHAAHEYAVSAYFEFAHALSVLARVQQIGAEMEALLELMTGGPETERAAREFHFPD